MNSDKNSKEDEEHIEEESEELDLDDLDDDGDEDEDDLETDLESEDLTEEEEFTEADFEDDDAGKGLFDEELEESETSAKIAPATAISPKTKSPKNGRKPADETASTAEDREEMTNEQPETAEAPTRTTTPLPPSEPVKIVPLKPEEIPLTVVIEVGHFNISVKKLLELEPGNLIEMDIHPERGVDLVVNGKLVGRAELIRLGDVLGVRVLEIGK